MKKTLAVWMAGLFLLTVPALAAAHGNGRFDGPSCNERGWVKDRHDHRNYGGHDRDFRYRSRHDHDRHWEKHRSKHFRKEVREHRKEHKRMDRFHRQHDHHGETIRLKDSPRLVFRIDL